MIGLMSKWPLLPCCVLLLTHAVFFGTSSRMTGTAAVDTYRVAMHILPFTEELSILAKQNIFLAALCE